ncbi:MAG: PAS domain S-box protein [Candidatus Omnitrophota bacterium]|nr:PAS domain S-box protein [Candidatus Omnitrophota bacterium]
MKNKSLGPERRCSDVADLDLNIYGKEIEVANLQQKARQGRFFFSHDFNLYAMTPAARQMVFLLRNREAGEFSHPPDFQGYNTHERPVMTMSTFLKHGSSECPSPGAAPSWNIRKSGYLFISLASLVAVLGILSYIPGLAIFGNIRPEFIPIAPSTALILLFLSVLTWVGNHLPPGRALSVAVALAGCSAFYGLLRCGEHLAGGQRSFENVIFPDLGRLGGIPIGIMSPITGTLVFFTGTALALWLWRKRFSQIQKWAGHSAGILNSAVVYVTLTFLLGYLYGTPFLYGDSHRIPVALTTSLGFLSLALGQITLLGGKDFPFLFFTGPSVRAKLLRVFLPLTAIIVVLSDYLQHMSGTPGHVHPEQPLLSAVHMMVFLVVAGFVTVKLSFSIGQRIDAEATGRRVAEEELRRANEWLQMAHRTAKIGHWSYKIAADAVVWSDEVFGIVGRHPSKGVPSYQEHAVFMHPDDWGPFQRNIQAAIDFGKPYDTIVRVKGDGGDPRFIHTLGAPQYDENGVITELFGTVQDISDIKRYEEAVRASEKKYRAVIETAMEGIYIVDATARIREVNDAYCRISGYSREEILRMTVPQLEAVESPEEVSARIARLRQMDYDRFETRHVRKDGMIIDVEATISFMDENKTLIAAFVRDISERKRTEGELRAYREKLEEMVKARTQELRDTYRKLEESRSQLIQTEKLSSIGLLAAGIAHELNSPLDGLLNLLRIYRKRAQAGSLEKEELIIMVDAGEHMAKIIKDLSSFARASRGEFAVLNLNEAMDSSFSFITHQLELKGIRIRRNYSAKPLQVFGNAEQIKQVVLNIVTNAGDAMPDGGTLEITTRESQDGKNIFIEFSDSGSGVKKEDLPKIFDPFFTTKPPGKGVGLGLSVSLGIVQNHKGEILVDSEPGRGSRFTIILPKAAEAQEVLHG